MQIPIQEIKAVLFDLDNTLRASLPNWGSFFAKEAARLGAPGSANDRLNAERWIYSYFATDQPAVDMERLGMDATAWRQNLHRNYLLALGCSPGQAEVISPSMWEIMQEKYQPERVILPGVMDTLEALMAENLIMGVVTNRNLPVHDYLEESGLSPFFYFSLAAGEIGIWKPDKGIFEHALLLAGVKAGETVYVGDNYYADIIGARNAGILPILVDYNNLFPEADCLRIESIHDLLPLLGVETS